MPVLKLETPEARYLYDMVGMCHFMIDCTCRGKDGKYSGAHYKNTDDTFERTTEDYQPELGGDKFQHTFMLNHLLFLNKLFLDHRKERKESPLVIVCNDCGREFPFTLESYQGLINRMRSARLR